ncbi:hypothetical protein AB1284_25585 [Bacillus sp. S2(2024)]|uniref:hypothetical protein n=1 Tax=Bacillus sp. S2(2024) TaxID=3162887 RepID=UPI003D1D3649
MDYMNKEFISILEDFKKKPTKEKVTQILKEFGVQSPEYWAEDEIKGNEAVLAAFRFLRPLQATLDKYLYDNERWVQHSIERTSEQKNPNPEDVILREMISAGISPEQIGLFAYWIARSAINGVLYRLSDPCGGDYDLPNEGEGLPIWRLEEYIESYNERTFNVERTGRPLPELHNIFPFHNPGEK